MEEIKIKRKAHPRGDNGYKNISVRMREELLDKLDDLAERTNYSRNELINFLLVSAIEIVKIEE